MRRNGYQILATLFIAAMILCSTAYVSDAQATVVRLAKGTEINLKFAPDQKVDGNKLAKGDSVDVMLTQSIVMDDSTIVESGALGKAVVLEAEKSGRGGKPGMIKVGFVYILPKGAFVTDDNQPILIEGELENKGGGKKLLSYLFIAGLFIKGGSGSIDTDQIYPAKIAESIKLRSQ